MIYKNQKTQIFEYFVGVHFTRWVATDGEWQPSVWKNEREIHIFALVEMYSESILPYNLFKHMRREMSKWRMLIRGIRSLRKSLKCTTINWNFTQLEIFRGLYKSLSIKKSWKAHFDSFKFESLERERQKRNRFKRRSFLMPMLFYDSTRICHVRFHEECEVSNQNSPNTLKMSKSIKVMVRSCSIQFQLLSSRYSRICQKLIFASAEKWDEMKEKCLKVKNCITHF